MELLIYFGLATVFTGILCGLKPPPEGPGRNLSVIAVWLFWPLVLCVVVGSLIAQAVRKFIERQA